MDELALIDASRAGDKLAFGSLVDGYYKSIYRLAYAYTGRHEEADDICQETFLRALNNIAKLRTKEKFGGWLFTIATNLVRKQVRDSRRDKALTSQDCDIESIEGTPDPKVQPVQKLSAEEEVGIVQQELQKMPERMRLVVILVLMEGVSQKDTAGILGYSESSTCRYLDAGRKWLRTRLEKGT